MGKTQRSKKRNLLLIESSKEWFAERIAEDEKKALRKLKRKNHENRT